MLTSPAFTTPRRSRSTALAPPLPAPDKMTFSELLDALHTASDAVRLHEVMAAVERLPIVGSPLAAAYFEARAKAAAALGLGGLARRGLHTPAEPSGAMPLPERLGPLNPDTSRPFGTNQLLTAALCAAVSQPRALEHLTSLGFTSAQAMPQGEGWVTSRPGVSVVVFRSLDEVSLRDVQLAPRRGFGGGQVHHALDAAFERVWPFVSASVERARASNPHLPVVFTGHGVGGALAVLSLLTAKHEGLLDEPVFRGAGSVAVLDTYGQPRVGDAAFARAFDQAVGSVPFHRYVYRSDPLAHFPPREAGYADLRSAQTVLMLRTGQTLVVPEGDGRLDAPADEAAVDSSLVNYLVMAKRQVGR